MPVVCRHTSEHIVTVLIDNVPRRNALGEEELRQLASIWPRLATDPLVRSVIVEGAGEAFCSGADLGGNLTALADFDDLIDEALLKTRFFPKPLLAAISGPCVAGGFELALSCDVRVVEGGATLGLPEVRWGILPSGGATAKLVEQIGHSGAMQMLLTGELVSGVTASQMGFGILMSGHEQTRAETRRLAGAIATASPVAVQATKRAVYEERYRMYAAREPYERGLVDKVRGSGHSRAGIAAFFEKRVPRYVD